MIEIRMPRLSESMTEGKLLLWNVAIGDHVQQGDQLAEVEADKANMEIEAPVSGVVCNLIGKPGDTIAVDTVLVELKNDPAVETGTMTPRATTTMAAGSEQIVESVLERRRKKFENNGNPS